MNEEKELKINSTEEVVQEEQKENLHHRGFQGICLKPLWK